SERKGKCVLCADVAEKACQRCGDFYCCKDCQVKDWQRHRYICFPMPALVYPSSFSLHQVADELSIQGTLTAAPDKDVDEAVQPPPARTANPIRNSDLNRDQSVSSTRSVTHQENPAIPETTNKVSNCSGSKFKVKHISNVSMPPSNTLVYLSAFSSSNRCYIRDAREPADVAFNQVCEKINAVGNEMPKLGKLHVYGHCLARHNGTFHRAQVLNIVNQNVKVMLIDQGTEKLRNRSDLREINEELMSLPCYSKVVQLMDVPHKIFNDAYVKFVSQFEGEKFVVFYQKTPGHISVDLINPNTSQSLNSLIRQFLSDKRIQADEMPQTSSKELPKQQSSLIEISKKEVIKSQTTTQNPPEKATNSSNHSPDQKKFPSQEFFEKILSFERTKRQSTTALGSETVPSTVESKSLEEDIKEARTQLKAKEMAPQNKLCEPMGLGKSPEANGPMISKMEPLLNPPFQILKFSIDGKDGIDVFVVDNSRIDRGIFGAFDSSYAAEFSTLNSQLAAITDSKPYKPAVKEYVIAKYEGLWHRGKVEQIKTSPNEETKYRVLYVDYTNVEDLTEQDIRRYPTNFTTPCSTNICVLEGFPHKPNAAQLSFLSEVIQPHKLVHIDSVGYLTNVAMIKSRVIMEKLNSL
ncbi:hypothetical protein KR026_009313, partial [Drosophila bipectinata]